MTRHDTDKYAQGQNLDSAWAGIVMTHGQMDKWMDEWMDYWIDGQTDGLMDGWMD